MKDEQWYVLTPYVIEERANLRCIGIETSLKLTNVGETLVVHIKENLSNADIYDLNQKLRSFFGDNTIVFCVEKDIDFLKIKKLDEAVEDIKVDELSNDEVKERELDGARAIQRFCEIRERKESNSQI